MDKQFYKLLHAGVLPILLFDLSLVQKRIARNPNEDKITTEAVSQTTCWSSIKEHELRTTIFDESVYHKMIRPQEQTEVDISMNLLTINELDMQAQKISMTGWLTMEWDDHRLNWTTSDFDDIPHVYAEDEEIWKPELFIDNSMEDISVLQDDFILSRVKNTGRVRWEYPRIFQTHCEIITTHYPFDTQRCAVEITSWAYTKEELFLRHLKDEIDTEDLKPNGEWIYLGSKLETNEIHEHTNDGIERRTQLAFYVVLKRRSEFYLTNIVLPILLTSFLNVLVFFLPADSGEKISYALTMLLTQAVFLTLIADSMPNTSVNISILSVYITLILLIGVFCVLGSVLTLKLHFKGEGSPPIWAMRVTDRVLVPLSCWNGCGFCKKRKKNTADKHKNGGQEAEMQMTGNDSEGGKDQEADGELNYSWVEIAAILDRFFLLLTIGVTILATVIFMIVLEVGGNMSAHI